MTFCQLLHADMMYVATANGSECCKYAYSSRYLFLRLPLKNMCDERSVVVARPTSNSHVVIDPSDKRPSERGGEAVADFAKISACTGADVDVCTFANNIGLQR